MSLLNKASLIQIPSGYKDGTLYSAKPTNGDGDFTFSRGSNLAATRVNSEGLIEKGRENLLTYSNDLTQWSSFGFGNITATTDPLGGNKAFILDDQDGGAYYRRESNTVSITGVVTSSVYIKKTTGSLTNYAGLEFNGEGVYVIFDTTNGTYNLTATSPYLFINVETAYDDWWRVSLAVSSFTSGQRGLLLWPSISSDGSTISASATGSNIFYAPQTEQGLVATDYIETTTTTAQAGILEDMPRLDYSGGATCPALKLEPQRSNLVTQSEYFGAYSNFGSVDTANQETSPEGVVNATLIEGDGSYNQIYTATPNITVPSAGDYTLSIFAKKGTEDYLRLFLDGFVGSSNNSAYFDLENGTTPTSGASIENYGNGWYRCSITATIDAGDLTGKLAFNVSPSTSTVFYGSAAAADGKNIYVYGAMLEAGSLTSYIPTYGSSVTRNKDLAIKSSATSIIGQTEGTLFFEIDDVDVPSAGAQLFSLDNGTQLDRIEIYATIGGGLPKIGVYVQRGGTQVANLTDVVVSGTHKIALAYKLNDYALYIDGVLKYTDTSALVPACDNVRLQGRYDNLMAGKHITKQALLFQTRLSNDELASLTTI